MQPGFRVTVEFMGPFEFEFGTASAELTVPAPATVATLLRVLAERWPAGQALWRSLSGEVSLRQRYCFVSVDYTALAPEAILDTVLHDGARVCFGMPMAGG